MLKNTPTQLGDAIVNAGFKVVLHATTRAYLLKEKGIIYTLNFHSEVHPLGIASTLEETQNDYYIFSKNNIKIAIINYSGFVGKSIPTKDKFMVNIISLKKVEETIQKLKPQVDFIILCVNWGEKSSVTPNKNQIAWAKNLAGLGVNLIIGNFLLMYNQ
jgi:poly-gamma-glutamate synthesis protein (capsule biosynthesis protein)